MDYNHDPNSDGKKKEHAISKVVHVRNLPPDCTEQDLIAIACPFGRVVNVLMLKGKNQAFIQMQDQLASTSLVQYYSSVQANIRTKPVYFQFSTRDEIQAPSNAPSTPPQNSILLVTIQNVLYPITIDILHQIFSKYGSILKIAIFTKTGLQALIQFADVTSAVHARAALDGQNIYSGCCTLRLQFSNLSNLNVKFNNEKSRDFTNPSLPSSPGPMNFPQSGLGVNSAMPIFPEASGWSQGYPQPGTPSFLKAQTTSGSGVGTSVVIVNNLDPEKPDIEGLFNLFGVCGDVIRIKILYNKKDTALIQYANAQQAETALMYLNSCPLNGRHIQVNASKHSSVAMPPPGADEVHSNLTRDFTNSPFHRYKVAGSKNSQNICPPSQVLHISNIPLNASEEMMKELFSQYGTVVGFKFFSKDKKMGLVQLATTPEAVECLIRLHNFKLSDGEAESTIKVSFSSKTL